MVFWNWELLSLFLPSSDICRSLRFIFHFCFESLCSRKTACRKSTSTAGTTPLAPIDGVSLIVVGRWNPTSILTSSLHDYSDCHKCLAG
ncbi:hypothetical protein F5146DRAFT_646804 [Armillaria mellea]|nr:hypothetical protein F5146DRAFT_646804 [Armillaria mellea]